MAPPRGIQLQCNMLSQLLVDAEAGNQAGWQSAQSGVPIKLNSFLGDTKESQ